MEINAQQSDDPLVMVPKKELPDIIIHWKFIGYQGEKLSGVRDFLEPRLKNTPQRASVVKMWIRNAREWAKTQSPEDLTKLRREYHNRVRLVVSN